MSQLKDIRTRAAFRELGECAERNRPKIAAVDLDGTILDSKNSEELGPPIPGVIEKLRLLREAEWVVVIWTVRMETPEMVAHLKHHEVPYDFINRHPWQPATGSAKIRADVYLDDRAIRFDGKAETYDKIHQVKPWWRDD